MPVLTSLDCVVSVSVRKGGEEEGGRRGRGGREREQEEEGEEEGGKRGRGGRREERERRKGERTRGRGRGDGKGGE